MKTFEIGQEAKKHKKKNIALGVFIIVMLLYPLFRFAIMWGYVNIRSLYISFTRYDAWTDSNIFSGFLQYKMVINNFKHDEYTQRTLLTSILYFPVTCFISLPLSVIFSYFLFKKVPGAAIYRVIFYLPSLMPIAVLTLSFKYAFGPSGFVDPILNALGFHNLPLWWGSSTVTPVMVFVYCVWAGLGYNIVLFSGGDVESPARAFRVQQAGRGWFDARAVPDYGAFGLADGGDDVRHRHDVRADRLSATLFPDGFRIDCTVPYLYHFIAYFQRLCNACERTVSFGVRFDLYGDFCTVHSARKIYT